jgi:hypothetical protein
MGKRRTLPPAATKCTCGHAFHEHVQGGDQHACQHGAQPPFTQMCPCKKFLTKEEELAHAELKRQSRRDRTKKKAESVVAPHAATVAPQTPPPSPHEPAAVTEAFPAGSTEEEPPKSTG